MKPTKAKSDTTATASPVKPDFTSHCFGGKIAEIPLPHVRLFSLDKRRKRKVDIIVTRFYPHPHYYVTLREEPNWIVHPVTGQLCSPYNDTGERGLEFSKRCNTLDTANEWVDEMFATTFRGRARNFARFQGNVPARWFYGEGD